MGELVPSFPTLKVLAYLCRKHLKMAKAEQQLKLSGTCFLRKHFLSGNIPFVSQHVPWKCLGFERLP